MVSQFFSFLALIRNSECHFGFYFWAGCHNVLTFVFERKMLNPLKFSEYAQRLIKSKQKSHYLSKLLRQFSFILMTVVPKCGGDLPQQLAMVWLIAPTAALAWCGVVLSGSLLIQAIVEELL